ncbi:phage tail tape measure protein [Candidatus Pacearchaeota archaeon]|jgi:TP901 family phage tail tape measure protein|nr:phage tail tape measure protein [Candidatus Pacearchaeota archaeon]
MTEAGRITAIIDGDISGLTSALNQAKSQATSAVSGIEGQFKSGIGKATSGGNWKSVGSTIGSDLVSGITAPLGSLGGAASSIATALGPTGIVATAAVAGAVMVGSAASRSAMEWEAGMSQISKTTGIQKGTDDFSALNSELKDLYSTMPTTVSEIQSVAAAAGSLGIEKSSIAGFTEVALQMGSAFDMPAEEAAVAMGKIKAQLKSLPDGVTDSTEFAKQMGSAIDYVGNNFNATEKDVLDFSTRTAGSLSALGGNAYEIAGWGGMLASVFPSAERAAGSFDSLLTQLTTNTDSQSAAAELLGVSTEDFMAAMSTDPSDTLLRIGSALEGLPADQLLSTAKALGGSYGMDTLTKMVGHTEEWGQAIDDTVVAGQKGESIGASFEAGADNAESAFQILKNSVGAILTDMGGPINSAITPVITAVTGSLNSIRTIGENLWEPFTAAISPATTAVSGLASVVGTLGGMTLGGLVSASSAINSAFKTGKAFVSAFVEELQEVVTSSSTFQALSGYVEGLSGTFSSLGDTVSQVWDDIVSGLTEAIPTAISGAGTAIGTLLDKAGLGGISDAAGSVNSFFGDVWDNAAEKLGWSTEKGTKEGMEKGAEDAAPAITETVESAVSSAAADGFNEAFWSNVEQWQSQGIQSGYALSAYAGMKVKSSDNDWEENVWTKTATVAGVEVGIHHDVSAQGSKYTLRINGADTGISRTTDNYDTTPRADLVQDMLADAGLSTDRGTALDLANKPLAAAQWRISQEQTVEVAKDYYLDFSENLKSEISGAGDEISTAFAESMVPDVATIDSRLEAIRKLKLYDPAEARRQGADNATAYLQALKDAIESVDAAKAKVLLDPDDAAAQAELKAAVERLQLYGEQNPITIQVEADTRLLYTQVLDAVTSLSGTALSIKLNELGISNVDRYTEYAREELRDALGELSTRGQSPTESSEMYSQFYELYKVLIDDYAGLDQRNKDFTWTLNEALMGNSAKWDEVYTAMGGKLDSTTSQVTEAISKSNDLLSKTAENTSDMCEAMSDFGVAQEQNWASMGMGLSSYIGSDAGYAGFLEEEAARGAYHPDVVELGSSSQWKADYEAKAESITMPATLDTSEADAQLATFQESAKEEQTIPVAVDDNAAMSAIAAIDAAASAPVTKIVYVQEVGGGSSVYNPYSGDYSGYTGAYSPGTGGYSGGEYWLPAFGAGDVFVPEPTLAIVGDRPGGEWIGGIDQAMARFGGNAGSQVVVNINQTVNIANIGTTKEELQSTLQEQGDWLKNEICKEVGYTMNRAEDI